MRKLLIALAAALTLGACDMIDMTNSPGMAALTVKVTNDFGHGSGVVVGKRTVLTAAHVVDDEGDYAVHLADGRILRAHVSLEGRNTDLALLETDEDIGIRPAVIGCGWTPRTDAAIVAWGYPGGAKLAVTRGIVASQYPYPGTNYIVTDMTLFPGMSGGPVFNRQGLVIAVNSAVMVAQTSPWAVSLTGLSLITPLDALCNVRR